MHNFLSCDLIRCAAAPQRIVAIHMPLIRATTLRGGAIALDSSRAWVWPHGGTKER